MMEPLRKELRIRAEPEQAFRRFTDEVARWWPRKTHSVSGASCAHVELEPGVGGRFLERAEDGQEHVWGTILVWEPPSRVSFTWHPGRDPASRQVVDVSFRKAGVDTVVQLVHSGWDSSGESARETREEYDGGWEVVLGLFGDTFIV